MAAGSIAVAGLAQEGTQVVVDSPVSGVVGERGLEKRPRAGEVTGAIECLCLLMGPVHAVPIVRDHRAAAAPVIRSAGQAFQSSLPEVPATSWVSVIFL